MNATARRSMKRRTAGGGEPDKRHKDDGCELIFNNMVFESDKTRPKNQKEKKITTETMLSRVQKVKERLASLKGTDEGKEMSNSIHWDEALKRASGAKVKNDPTKLKKTIKRAAKIKQRSKDRWATYKEAVEKAKEEGHAIPKTLTKPKPKKAKKKKKSDEDAPSGKGSKRHANSDDEFEPSKGGKKGGKKSGGKSGGKGSKGSSKGGKVCY